MNFDRLRFVAERAELGEQREAILAVTIPGAAGQLPRILPAPRQAIGHRIQLSLLRRAASRTSSSGSRSRTGARPTICSPSCKQRRIEAYDLSDNEMAKLHVRHLVGGHAPAAKNEILYRFEFPERPGALMTFLEQHEPRLEHQPVPLSQPRRRLRPRARRDAGAAAGQASVPRVSGPPWLRLHRGNRTIPRTGCFWVASPAGCAGAPGNGCRAAPARRSPGATFCPGADRRRRVAAKGQGMPLRGRRRQRKVAPSAPKPRIRLRMPIQANFMLWSTA